MISRLAETGDSESSEPHVSVVKETSNTTECHVASNEGHQKTNEAIQLKVFETEDNDSNQGDCTLAVSLSHVSAQYGVSSKTESESSNNFMKCSSVTETVNAMTTNTPDVHKNDDSEQSIQHKLRIILSRKVIFKNSVFMMILLKNILLKVQVQFPLLRN
ncbi:uncharacterized protein LOC113376986 [Ctenocephalides felis]|uniref:uncharacterized protein LOC113376986 n=1 Tax=Ctenocephalides felis TaxID=7515 RepID=UPI000E6E1FC9|nr:uncharacterized protein LOC113376986 [Ctenocephalides felis]